MIHKELKTEDQWTTGTLARNDYGMPVPVDFAQACKFCLWGWVMRCYPDPHVRQKIEKKILDYIGGTEREHIGEWNDDSLFEEVQTLTKELGI